MNNIKELLEIHPSEVTQEDNDALIEEIMNAQLIMPIEITTDLNFDDVTVGDTIQFEDGLRFKPLKIANDAGDIFIPLYTDDDEVHGHTSAIDIQTSSLADMIDDNPENINGVVINPFSEYSVEIPMDSFLKLFEKEKD
ncbi:MAG: SseB family protein [Methanobrevibacter sp.]|uniref:SseB family protein n=1 Tax=Methanobrevibacter sp. TaxID=66852 RepID=UPI0025DDCD46|nr:SseB family protein [Methanobrevibacter sp.]MBR0271770.1 SseB family protein [Methanobrevibacter sp.]